MSTVRKRIKIFLIRCDDDVVVVVVVSRTDEVRKTALGQLDTPFTINLNVRLKRVNEDLNSYYYYEHYRYDFS